MAQNNSTILDAIWMDGTTDYQQRVPQASQAGVSAVQEFLFNPMNKQYFNQFVDALINRVGKVVIRDNQWKNPLTALKKDGIEHGSTIQEIAFKLLKAKGYNLEDLNLFVNEAPEALVAYHTVNREDRYDLTIQSDELRKAFVNEGGLSEFISTALALPITSDQYDEFQIMKQLLAEYGIDNMFNVNIPDITSSNSQDDARLVLKKLIAYAERLRFLNTKFNKAGYPTFARPEDMFIFCTPDVKASLDVDGLATLFHLEKAEVDSRIIVLDEFPAGEASQLFLVHGDWFVCGDYVNEVDSFYNPKSRTQNYYLHRWGVYSASPFMPIIRFSTDADTNVPTVTTTVDVTANFDATSDITDIAPKAFATVSFVDPVTNTPANESLMLQFIPEHFVVSSTELDTDRFVRVTRNADGTAKVKVLAGAPSGKKFNVEFAVSFIDPASGAKTEKTVEITYTIA